MDNVTILYDGSCKCDRVLRRISSAVSYVLHPFLMPVWFMALLFGTGLLPVYVSSQVRNYILAVMFTDMLLVPALAIMLMHLFRVIRDYSLSSRKDTILPLFIVALCYGLCGWMISSFPMLFLLRRMMFASMACTLFCLLGSMLGRISIHLTAAGAVVGMALILLYAGYPNMVWVFCVAVLCAGMLGSARLCLRKSTPSEEGIGFAGGFAVSILMMLFA